MRGRAGTATSLPVDGATAGGGVKEEQGVEENDAELEQLMRHEAKLDTQVPGFGV